jgi:hypothetical protein
MAGKTSGLPPRTGNGKFARSPKTAERDYQALDLRVKGRSLQSIADELGFSSRGAVTNAIHRAFRDLPLPGTEDAKQLDLERIDRLIGNAWTVMEREHVAYSNGQVIRRRTGEVEVDESGLERLDDKGRTIPVYEEVLDDGPLLASIDRIRSLLERRAKIIGYDAPARSRIEVITEDVVDAELKALSEEIAAHDRDRAGTR